MSGKNRRKRVQSVETVHTRSVPDRPDPSSLDIFIREEEARQYLEADLKVFFRTILDNDEFNVVTLRFGLFGEGRHSEAEIGPRLKMNQREVRMLKDVAWRKIKGHQAMLKEHLKSRREA